ncbi:MAG: TonB-dependent receptor [Candidatus Marinimicrobia bacterium]|nr:TonB-dependent receptor [Candidatus Neomarinimicrobiota bacterium]
MLHLRYDLDRKTVLRAAFTSSLARPNYYDLVPYIMFDDGELFLGNSELDPTVSNNLDLMAEFYIGSLGLISGGFFQKTLKDYIYIEVKKDVSEDIEEQYQPVNGKDATLSGFEFSWQQQLTFLPGALNGLGIYLNYTGVMSTL